MNQYRIPFAAGLLLLSGTAMSVEHGGTASFDELDQNGDGMVTMGEAQQHQDIMQSWTEIDANNDGQIDQAEFSAFESMRSEEGAPAAGDAQTPAQ